MKVQWEEIQYQLLDSASLTHLYTIYKLVFKIYENLLKTIKYMNIFLLTTNARR